MMSLIVRKLVFNRPGTPKENRRMRRFNSIAVYSQDTAQLRSDAQSLRELMNGPDVKR